MAKGNSDNPNGAALFEAANKLWGSVESAEYKHLVLGLIFLKYISDAFEHNCPWNPAEGRLTPKARLSPKHSRLDCLADRRKRSAARCAVSARSRGYAGDAEMPTRL